MEDAARLTIGGHLWQVITMQFFGLISLTVNVVGSVIIWRRTPGLLSEYRYFLLYIQACSFLVDFCMAFIVCPVVYLPILGGTLRGALSNRWIQVSPHLLAVILLVLMGFQFAAMLFAFIHKHQTTIPIYSPLKLSPNSLKFAIFCLQTFFLLPAIFFGFSAIPRDEQRFYLEQNFFDSLALLNLENTEVYAINTPIICFLSSLVAVLLVAGLLFALLSFHLFHILEMVRGQMSRLAFKMHRSATMTLILQVVVPYSAYSIPVIGVVVSVGFRLNNVQEAFNAFLCLFCLHSTVETLVTLMSSRSYRFGFMELTKELIFWMKTGKKIKANHNSLPLQIEARQSKPERQKSRLRQVERTERISLPDYQQETKISHKKHISPQTMAILERLRNAGSYLTPTSQGKDLRHQLAGNRLNLVSRYYGLPIHPANRGNPQNPRLQFIEYPQFSRKFA